MQDLYCLQLPMPNHDLLVPSNLVLEVLKVTFTPFEEEPEWLQGILQWHDFAVPVINITCFNAVANHKKITGPYLAIFKALDERVQNSVYAVQLSAPPVQCQVAPADLIHLDLSPGRSASMFVELESQVVMLPDLSYIESQIIQWQVNNR